MRAFILMIAIGAVMPITATAQIAANSKIDAVVQLEQAPDPPLELTAVNAMDFGTVTIPNKSFVNTRCTYSVLSDGSAQVREVNDSQTRDTNGTLQSGCRFIAAPVPGRMQFRCIADRNVIINILFASGSSTSLVLRKLASALVDEKGGNLRMPQDGVAGPCAVGSPAGRVADRFLSIGGSLTVSQDYALPLRSRLTVGTVTVDATYS